MGEVALATSITSASIMAARRQAVRDAAHLSTYVEQALELGFLGDLMRVLWERDIRRLEVLRADIDAWGYDVALSIGDETRYVQLKARVAGGRTATLKLNGRLEEKPGGCVVWMEYDPLSLRFTGFGWLGGSSAGDCLRIRDSRRARHTKGTAEGIKRERADSFEVPLSRMERLGTLDQLAARLFPLACSDPGRRSG